MSINLRSASRSRCIRKGILGEINVTPFVDVMLVLLIIFMLTSPMLVSGIKVDLPKTKASPLSSTESPIIISIDKNGKTYIQEMELANFVILQARLKTLLGENKNTRIFIRSDRNIKYGKVMALFAAIKNAGFSNIALITEIKELKNRNTKK